ncbi:TonB-linked SusC/RagA family outer membrane protein [Mariniflexile fucanivorans]|uniref:TonB-linked SusC/RagA family outer membrane protein n=1 Tax=Mariniflexile fucanivorans TaxID=264023 RepID=A0A4R1RI11_9FLAO|nr:TonB-dependent receptor [Mariniflexile fucanivorans]TCL65576.1 TonB-linked SusC/RagA family outer membrane protein [Mariniflexile fucanivorans]
MKIKLNSTFFFFRKRLLLTILNSFAFLCFTSVFSLPTNTIGTEEKTDKTTQQLQISGVVTDANGQPLSGANILEKGTTNGVQADFDGKFLIKVSSEKSIIVASYIGFVTKEVTVNNQKNINIVLNEDVSALDEVVVVGYGTQKKVNLTAALSVVGTEVFADRPTANAVRSLQGTVPGLVISNSTSGGEPGADSNINIRGFITASGGTGNIGDAEPLVLVDGIRMNMNDINPEDIESVSVLKDAAAASIYGSNAAAGAILVTTKTGKNSKGKAKVSYRSNISFTQPTTYPKLASPIDFAYTMNDARINNFQAPYHDETDLANIRANMANPGSAPSIVSNANGNDWNYGVIGLEGTGATNWDDIIIKKWSQRTKHDLSISGGDQKLNYYVSVGAYDEDGLLAVTDESFQRYNLDAKFSAQVNKWLTVELYSKFLKSFTDFPTQTGNGSTIRNKTQVLDLLTKIKPTLPQFDPIYGEELIAHTYYPFWKYQRIKTKNDQIILSPKFIIQASKDLKLNVDLNYRRNNNFQEISILAHQMIVPNGLVDRVSQKESSYSPTVSRTEYFSPNFYATYDKSINNHNFNVTTGITSELNNFYSLNGNTGNTYLISNSIVSLNATATDADTPIQEVNESITNWSTVGYFGRFRYNYKEKYLLEFTYRRDAASRFAPEDRWVGLPSFSAGYNIAKEDFWPIDAINTFKLRGSYGSLGNQNVANYLYLSLINTGNTTGFLFDGQQANFSQTPGLLSESLTWETVKTTDIGFDLGAFNNKLSMAFSWYRVDTEDMAGPGLDLPAQLGTAPPLRNVGTSRVQGFDFEVNWRQQLGDFGYNIRAVLNDYKQTITEYPNDTNNLNNYYEGQNLGEIYGYETDGLFQTNEEATAYTDMVDQSFVNGFAYTAGDLKYVDQNGDGVIDNGSNTLGDSGDLKVIGNTTPRYQYGITLGFNYKNFDFNAFVQGVGKRDVNMVQGNSQGFRGPSNGPFHAFVWEGHLDYFRGEDTVNPLGPNLDAYFPKPYLNGGGRTNKNYRLNTTHFIQSGAYTRLKSLQIGYTIPKNVTKDLNIDNIRMYVTGENLFTVTDLMFFDPEQVRDFPGNNDLLGSASSYPLSRIVSFGVNVSF